MGVCEVSIVAPRLDAKPWGGRKLERFGLPLPEGERVGEALVTANDAGITAGAGEGQTLGELVVADPADRLGWLGLDVVSNRPIFPLLVKLIDAAENLSIQVHPDDDLAAPLGELGKSEAWYVLSADPGGALYLGLDDDIDIATFMEHAWLLDGSSAHDLRRKNAQEGQAWMIPAGTVHALGAGVMVYEIQQPSDVTFRLDDWGRVDAQGNPREMHLRQGEAAIRPELRPNAIPAIRLDSAGMRQLLVACRYFALEKLGLPEGYTVFAGASHTPNVITVLSGELDVNGHRLSAGGSAVIWPGSQPVTCTASSTAVALRAWVPDIEHDLVQPARTAGALESDIAALGGMTGDIAAAIR